MKPKLKAILFDMGSTLIEFENSTWDVLNQRCAREGYGFLKKRNLIEIGYDDFWNLLAKEFEKRWIESNKTLKEIKFEDMAVSLFDYLGLNMTDGNLTEFMKKYYQPVTDQITLIQGAGETLKFFKEKNLKLGLISNTIFPQRFHLEELKRFALAQYLDLVLFSSEVGYKKPHPKIFETALERLDIAPDFIVFVGDRLDEDIGGAQNMGMTTILIPKDGRDYSAPIVPDARIERIAELPDIVAKLFDI
jgi:putative hydrolase of the HAD superfamily